MTVYIFVDVWPPTMDQHNVSCFLISLKHKHNGLLCLKPWEQIAALKVKLNKFNSLPAVNGWKKCTGTASLLGNCSPAAQTQLLGCGCVCVSGQCRRMMGCPAGGRISPPWGRLLGYTTIHWTPNILHLPGQKVKAQHQLCNIKTLLDGDRGEERGQGFQRASLNLEVRLKRWWCCLRRMPKKLIELSFPVIAACYPEMWQKSSFIYKCQFWAFFFWLRFLKI